MGKAYTGLFENPLTHNMYTSVPIPKVHPTKGLTGRKMDKMYWAITMLQDQDTLSTYEDFARESANE